MGIIEEIDRSNNGIEEVVGSIPSGSTTIINSLILLDD
jgi:hypothetical protein